MPSRQRSKKKPYHHGDLKPLLIRTAVRMLERDGAEAVSLREVARAAGVSATAPYNHFDTKEDLLAVIAAEGFRDLEASQRKAGEGTADTAERIIALGVDYVAFAAAHPQLYRLMFGVALADWHARPAVAEAKAASFVPAKEAIAKHVPNDLAEVAAIAAWALVHGLAMLRIDKSIIHLAGGFASGTLERRVVERFVRGLHT